MADDTTIPVTSMTKLYWEVHSSQEERLALASEYVKNPRVLAEKFVESRKQFEREFVDWSAFPFHTRQGPLTYVLGDSPVSRTRDLAAALGQEGAGGDRPTVRWQVDGAPELSFVYLDREIQPARTDVETEFGEVEDAPEKAPKKLSFDLLLANADDRTPVVCEVKLTTEREEEDGKVRLSTDKDPFFALIQVLTSTAHLATKPQIKRLSSRYDIDIDDGLFDVYVIIRGEPAENAKYWFQILSKSKELSVLLLDMPEIHEVIRRIEFLNVEAKNIADGKSDDDLNPWFRYPESPESPEFTLNFSRI